MYSEKRIEEKISNESHMDWDWFLIDRYDRIAIIASGGGLLPDSVACNAYDYDIARKYFRALPIISPDLNVGGEIKRRIDAGILDKNELTDTKKMVPRGLFYFDKIEYLAYYDFAYYMKARPVVALTISQIDPSILQIIKNTRIDADFDTCESFNSNEIA